VSRAARKERNQALFREVNERIAGVAADWELHAGQSPGPTYPFICECGKVGCREQVTVSLATYISVTAQGDGFLVAPGHERRAEEDVVWQTDHFAVVRPKAFSAGLRLIPAPED
jgi:hypothetical protein